MGRQKRERHYKVFPQGDSQEEWDSLRSSTLSTKKFLELIGDEFPDLKCIHFVLFGSLGGGVTDTSRPDALGKVETCLNFMFINLFEQQANFRVSQGLAEFVRARIVDYPEKLYRGPKNRI